MTPSAPVRIYALLLGAVTHLAFGAAIILMVLSLYDGMRLGFGPARGLSSAAWNLALLLQFPILHSWLLSSRGRALLARLAPSGLGGDLVTTMYALVASLQLGAVFLLWSPTGILLWEAHGVALWVSRVAFALSWVLLARAIIDGGASVQTGFAGWSAVFRGRKPSYGPMPETGLFRYCRQPIYLAFAATLWTGPTLTLDRLLLALSWTIYCVVGPVHKEQRYRRYFGERFERYRRRVPYLLPRLP
ncbi:MAG: isoprenylcysteine carboxylmethyltransferase family protein [Planctomycetes bacterium]|nr:isoprenylcysteine carboxylmethyltransferase family protein [Planctomycetota bacterium]